jgi:prepilin-type processing-associated H-X9-DG protein
MRRGIIAVLALVLLAVVALTQSGVLIPEWRVREATLRQFSTVLKAYANEAKGIRYPPNALDTRSLLPEPELVAKYIPDTKEAAALKDLIHGRGARRICYLGHLVLSEYDALHVLDLYERDIARVRDIDISPAPLERDNRDAILRFREGVCRFYIHEIMNPAASAVVEEQLPVAWEIPERYGERALVLYVDGHVEWQKYPGKFPMTRRVIERVCEMAGMAIPADSPPMVVSPIEPAVQEAVAIYQRWIGPADWQVERCDETPTVELSGRQGYRAVVGGANHSELVLFPVTPESPMPDVSKDEIKRVLGPKGWINMGAGKGYHWFGNLNFSQQLLLHEQLKLTGGEDQYELFAACHGPYMRLGDAYTSQIRALPELQRMEKIKQMIEHPRNLAEYAAAYRAKREIEGRPVPEEVGIAAMAIGPDYYPFSVSKEVVDKAMRVLMNHPDHEAVALAALAMAGDEMWRNRNETGIVILKSLPKETIPFVKDVARRLPRAKIQQAVNQLP